MLRILEFKLIINLKHQYIDRRKLMNISIISPGYLPVPSIKGGAVEGLIEILINYNEKYAKKNLIIYSIYDENAENLSKRYNNKKIIYIKMNRSLTYMLKRKIIPISIYYWFYCNKVAQIIKLSDICVIENEFSYIKKIKKVLPDMYTVLHLHNDYIERKAFNNIIDKFNSVITVSNFLKNKIKKDITIETIYNGVDFEKFSMKNDDNELKYMRDKLGIAEKDKVLVYAGRISEEKGVLELVKAFTNIKLRDITLIIIGNSGFKDSKDSAYVRKVKELAKQSNNNIIFTGYVDHNELDRFYKCADIGCVPSLCNEAFGLTIIEQMACGLPVIGSDKGAIPEIIDHECGIIVKKNEYFVENLKHAMIDLIINNEKRQEMSIKAYNRSQKFSKEIYAKKMFKFFEENYKRETKDEKN